MAYRVIKRFVDLQDGGHAYGMGEKFPRDGHVVTDERIHDLSTGSNKLGVPLIEEIPKRKTKK
jgi:hypothetical protein